ncbi:MAG: PAS domain S-box protein [Syntrophomonas sp.]
MNQKVTQDSIIVNAIEMACDGCLILNNEWKFDYISPKSQLHFTKPVNELLGKSFWEELPSFVNTRLYSVYLNGALEQKPIQFQNFNQRLNRWYEVNVLPGQSNTCIIFNNITRQKQAEDDIIKLEQTFSKVFYSSPVAMGITTVEDCVHLKINKSWTDMFGYSEEEALGKTTSEMNLWVKADKGCEFQQQLLSRGRIVNFEMEYKTKTGNIGFGLISAEIITINGEASRLISVTNITERKGLEDQQNKLYQSTIDILESISDVFFAFNRDFKISYWNRAAETMFNLPRQEVLGKIFWEVFPKYSSLDYSHLYNKAVIENQTVDIEILGPYTGSWVQARAYPSPEGFSVYLQNITERKLAEQALAQSEERFNKVFYASPAMMTISRLEDGVIVNANDAFLNTFSFPREDVIGHTYQDLGLYIRRADILEVLDKTGIVTNYEGLYKSFTGQQYTCLISLCIIQISGISHILAYGIDITQRKHVELVLKESEQRMSDIINFLPDATFVIDEQGKVIAWNGAIEEMTGVKAADIIGRGDYQYSLPFYGVRRPIIIDLVQFADKEREETYASINRESGYLIGETYCPKIGRFLQGTASLLYNSGGDIVGAIESIRDISMNISTLESLRQSEERFYKAFHSSPVMMSILRIKDNRYLEINQKFLDASGFKREELIGHDPIELGIWPDKIIAGLLLEELRQKGRLEQIDYKLRIRSGKIITTISSWELIKLNGQECRLAVMQDVTEKLEVEAKLARLDRLNLIGEMAASIGHEIRNPMTSIRGFLQMLSYKNEYTKDLAYFDLMIEELDRANAIISEYLGMAKDKRIDPQPQYLDNIVNSIYPMIQADANYLEMNVKLELGKPPVPLIDAKEIRQLIINMARNGLEAMQPGGVLTIGTTANENDIVLFIKDQGHGLDPGLIEKLGTPFITTKDKGTGLGLAVCYSIAARHNAKIDHETGPEGTTFYVRFPLPQEQVLPF